jgi:lysophospholipase L1-like esterase
LIDNILIRGRGDAPPLILAGRTVYAFGDSIVAGHIYQGASFPDFVARQEGMILTKKAVNGATVMPGANSIVDQLLSAPTAEPDYVLFDGGTNDAYPSILTKLGTVTAGFPSIFDTDTFAGAFEDLISKIKARYPRSKLLYVAVARLGARDRATQATLRDIELRICAKWGVAVADVYAVLDTSSEANRIKYSFDSLQPGGQPDTAETKGGWIDQRGTARPTGTHPNFPAIETFYAPIVGQKMRAIW